MARWILALLLLAMALGQVADPSGFVDLLETYDVGGGRAVSWALAALLVVGEIVAGAGLLGRAMRTRRVGAAVSVAVAILWSVLAVQAFARGLVVDNCGCFGVYLGQPLRWWVLLQDAYLLAISAWVWRGLRRGDAVHAGAGGRLVAAVETRDVARR